MTLTYDQNGNQIWKSIAQMGSYNTVQVVGLALDSSASTYVVANGYDQATWSIYSYAADGSGNWSAFNPTGDTFSRAHALALDNTDNALVIGQNANFYPNMQYGSYKINTNGVYVWTNLYPNIPTGTSVAIAIATDHANSVYVTGSSPGTNSSNDIVTIKYAPNGDQTWLQRYSSSGNGNAVGNAIVVDNNGNVYVTGYETTAAGGTEIVTIKYSPVTVQRRSDGTVLLQAQGSPGESFDIQASADLQSWLDLGIFTADTNGLLQFDDTNAPNFSSRFYFTNPQ